MDAKFIEIRNAGGNYAGEQTAIFRRLDGSTFGLSRHDVQVRLEAKSRIGRPTEQETAALAAFLLVGGPITSDELRTLRE